MIGFAALFSLIQAATPQGGAAELPVKMGFSVTPDTVLVGQPFDLLVKVHAPAGVRFEFPDGPDTTMENGVRPIELRGERIVSMLADTAVAVYRLLAWDVGVQPLRIPDVKVTSGGLERLAPLGAASVFVQSVLPAADELRIPKPARPLIVLPPFNWWPWIALAIAALVSGLLWWAWRRYRNRALIPVDPYVRAQREFARIEARELVESGAAREHLAAMVDVARAFLAARIPGVRRSHTSTELLRTMRPEGAVEGQLLPLLERADLAKFARADVGPDEAVEGGRQARDIVDHVEARVNPESEPAKRAAAAKGRAA
ncbi:MAG TPA: hypothetical protein VNO75_02375 [Gemmatimonadaceae bacterium]|nr:hypothetical protein [Gemmatimonadaceae bacterium]